MFRKVRILAGGLAMAAAALVPATGRAQPAPVVAAGNDFGYALLDRLCDASPGETVLISPYSLSVALTMVAQGAAGATADAFTRALGLDGIGLTAAAEMQSDLRQAIESATGPQVELAIANALWVTDDITLRPGFVERQEQDFAAAIDAVDFLDPATVTRINDWVSQATGGMIPGIVDRFSPETLLFLANAVYFKGMWTDAFDPEQTRDQAFTLGDGGTRTVAMMQRRDQHYRYAEGPDFQAVDLPYGDGAFSMTVILPAAGATEAHWDTWLSGPFAERAGMLQMPRLDLAWGTELQDLLAAMGLAEAFQGTADFSAMVDIAAHISSVIHKTALQLDEEGTRAAAVTGITVERTSTRPDGSFLMVVDRPFYLAIRHRDTGLVLFLGFVGDPGPAV